MFQLILSLIVKPKKVGFAYENIVEKDSIKTTDGKYVVEIGSDVWLGDGVKILNGVKIGDGE